MNKDMLKGDWKQIRGRLKSTWGELTDDDLARIDGDWDQVVGAIQKRTGKVRKDIESGLADLLDRVAEETREMPPVSGREKPAGPR